MSRHIDSSGRSASDLHAVARWGMREELCLEPHEYSLELLAFVLDPDSAAGAPTSTHGWT